MLQQMLNIVASPTFATDLYFDTIIANRLVRPYKLQYAGA